MKKLANYGYVQFFRSGEYHHNSPLLMKTLHKVTEASPGKAGGGKAGLLSKTAGGGSDVSGPATVPTTAGSSR